MNALQSVLHTPKIPRIAPTNGSISVKMVSDILKEEVPGIPGIVTAEQIASLLGIGQMFMRHTSMQSVHVSVVQLRAIAKDVAIISRHVPFARLLRERSVRPLVTMERGLLAAAEDLSELHMPRMGYSIILRDMGGRERKSAIAAARLCGFKERQLSLSTALTAMVLSHIFLGRSPARMYETRSRLCSGQYFAVGPDGQGRITVRAVSERTFPPAIGFVHSR